MSARAEPDLVGIDFAGTGPGRTVASNKNGSSAGSIADPFRHRTYTYDSENERTVITVLGSFSTVVRIEEQVKVDYRLDGVERIHFLDARVVHRGGKRIAYAMKAKEKSAESDKAKAVLRAIEARHGSRFADDYRFVSFEALDPVTVLNAKLITRCGDELDEDGRHAVRAVLPGLGPVTTAAKIGASTGLDARGMRAALALIPSGALLNLPGRRLTFDSPLTNQLCADPANQAA